MKKESDNYLDKIPKRSLELTWENLDGNIVLQKENKGTLNVVFQKVFKKPKVSMIHLDKKGSFIWKNIDGKMSIYEIGQKLSKEFGDEAQPLYERLLFYINTLHSYKFIDI